MDDAPEGNHPFLTYGNVGIAAAFVVLDVSVSFVLKLGVGTSLLISAVRCVIQLSLMGLVLDKIFATKHPAAVFGLAALLMLLGTLETTIDKCKTRFRYMFPSVLFAFVCSVMPISIIGSIFAIKNVPFWTPDQYVPILGMLCGTTISALVVVITATLKELHDNKDKTETMLAMGATRYEACLPIAKDSLTLALTPVINQMSVLGIISIPGLMSGAILGGSSVEQAAKLQMIMMFLIASSTALATIVITVIALSIVVDPEHRLRSDRIDTRDVAVHRAFFAAVHGIAYEFRRISDRVFGLKKEDDEEHERLLG
ncbi:UPF0014-domain-containing protein [Calocera viscosa TUFC12733]|uniref:UPF0014-domain-containing protein n=1 Tax=Calocera viscosa (strain TUFC12733) TaxID=1330018 RepID=A0A167R6M3_CALVF|nr:UPF0014-domain-containing protein [Calocera viscosa TUFC12733]